jgi:hypothetical protein
MTTAQRAAAIQRGSPIAWFEPAASRVARDRRATHGAVPPSRDFSRPSGSNAQGFLDGEHKSVEPEVRPMYLGPPSGRIPTPDEKRCAWQLREEYLAGRLGKNGEENR